LFYNNDDFFRFHDRCLKAGIRVPIVPGVLPVTNWAQVQRITSLCGARLPEKFAHELQAQADSPEGQFAVGVEFATRQVQQLIDRGVPGLHFYVLNKSPATAAILGSVKLPHPTG
jgi:methylenetetrahydrofolate reductase (NADPH)